MPTDIDARIAEEVMGRKTVYAIGELVFDDSPSPVGERVPAYSTDMNAAMEVVEKMRERGFDFGLQVDVTWWAIFTSEEINYGGTKGQTPALAICLAALEAVKRA